jgi:hypothetical protein
MLREIRKNKPQNNTHAGNGQDSPEEIRTPVWPTIISQIEYEEKRRDLRVTSPLILSSNPAFDTTDNAAGTTYYSISIVAGGFGVTS